ncbi:MAG: hypothetical protein UT43_C0020G0023 [Parcubacteria group bacterium GW2011_GWC1_39_29]|nr:MAG: hypothetical protein UT43_C0020G0023 [Parcubacteria group bacterium GW2011_GWC1_39_29]
MRSTIVTKLASASTLQSRAGAPPRIVVSEKVIDFTDELGEPDDVDAEDLLSDVELDLAEHQLGSRTLGQPARVRDLVGIEQIPGRREVVIESATARHTILIVGLVANGRFADPNRDGEDPADRPSTGRHRAIDPESLPKRRFDRDGREIL